MKTEFRIWNKELEDEWTAGFVWRLGFKNDDGTLSERPMYRQSLVFDKEATLENTAEAFIAMGENMLKLKEDLDARR